MADYIEAYGAYLRQVKRASENTVTSYLRDVRQFEGYLRAVPEVPVEACTQEHVEDYMDYMTGHGKSNASVARGIASLKSFFSYLISVGVVESNPAKGVSPSAVYVFSFSVIAPQSFPGFQARGCAF